MAFQSFTLHTDDGDVNLVQASSRQKIKLAYTKHNFARYRFEGMTFFPDVIPMNDTPKITDEEDGGKGRDIPVRANWWKHIEKINNPLGYKYTRSVYKMWINTMYDQDTPYSTAKAESVHCGGNFFSWDIETSTHVRMISWANDYDTSLLDPAIHNWKNMPHMFWKACSVERNGTRVQNVGNGLDVYFPLLCNIPQFGLPAELWMMKSKIELLGEEEFTFKDGNVYLNGGLFHKTGAIPPKE